MNYLYETDKAYLEPITLEHSDCIHSFINDYDILNNYITPSYPVKPMTVCDVMDMISEHIALSTTCLAILHKTSLKVIGICSISCNNTSGVAGISIFIAKEFRNKGIGSSILNRLNKVIFDDFNMQKICFHCYSFSKAVSLYTRIGYKKEATLERMVYRQGTYHGLFYWSMNRDSYYKNIANCTTV